MGCNFPLRCWYEQRLTEKGKKVLTFRRPDSWTGKYHEIACGQCTGCRLERSRQWAMRCMHEKQLHMFSSFVTLTYDDEHLPQGGSLVKRDLQLFMKRLRKKKGAGVRFYGCGEYGDMFDRPHYHVLLFNCRFPDQRKFKTTEGGHDLFRSEELQELWPDGHHWIGDVTFESCAYVARYILKKVTGAPAEVHYAGREPEFTVMSRRPGIASGWFDRYHTQTYDWDSVVFRGKEMSPPRFYDLRYELLDSERMRAIKLDRRRRALLFKAESTPDRRYVREIIARRRQLMFGGRKL